MDLAALVEPRHPTQQIDALIEEYLDLYDVVPSSAPAPNATSRSAYGAAIELGLRTFLEDGGFGAFTTSFEDLGTLRQLPGLAVQRLMADGYGFGAEGDWKTAMLVRDRQRDGRRPARRRVVHGGLHVRPGPGPGAILGAHMLEVSPSLSSRARPPRGRTHSASAARKTRCASSSPPTPAPPWSSR